MLVSRIILLPLDGNQLQVEKYQNDICVEVMNQGREGKVSKVMKLVGSSHQVLVMEVLVMEVLVVEVLMMEVLVMEVLVVEVLVMEVLTQIVQMSKVLKWTIPKLKVLKSTVRNLREKVYKYKCITQSSGQSSRGQLSILDTFLIQVFNPPVSLNEFFADFPPFITAQNH